MQLGLIPTLFFFFGLLSLVYAAGLHFYLRDRNKVVVGHWSLGILVWGASVLLTLLRVELPLLLSYFLANALAFMAHVEINRGLQAMTGQAHPRVRRGLDLLLVLAYTAGLYVLDLWTPPSFKEAAKTGFVSLAMVVVAVQGAQHCFAIGRRHAFKLAHNLGLVFLLVGLLWAARIVASLAGLGTHAFDPSVVNTLIFVSLFITGVLKYLALPLLLLHKVEQDKQAQFRRTLAKANKSVTSGALSASIAHELNQPLAAIRINGQTLRRALAQQAEGRPSEDVQAMIGDILSENERAAKIIASLRAIFTLNPSVPTAQDCESLVRRSLAMVAREMECHHIRVELDLADGLQVFMAEDEFSQVLLNLLLNSLHALREQTGAGERVIAIRARCQGGQTEIEVSDNGPGVPPHMEDTLFEILSTSKDSGMGVGLWLCKYIVERHGGRMSHAPSPLGGAAFSFTLPQVQGQRVHQRAKA